MTVAKLYTVQPKISMVMQYSGDFTALLKRNIPYIEHEQTQRLIGIKASTWCTVAHNVMERQTNDEQGNE